MNKDFFLNCSIQLHVIVLNSFKIIYLSQGPRDRAPIHWFTFQMSTMTVAGPHETRSQHLNVGPSVGTQPLESPVQSSKICVNQQPGVSCLNSGTQLQNAGLFITRTHVSPDIFTLSEAIKQSFYDHKIGKQFAWLLGHQT